MRTLGRRWHWDWHGFALVFPSSLLTSFPSSFLLSFSPSSFLLIVVPSFFLLIVVPSSFPLLQLPLRVVVFNLMEKILESTFVTVIRQWNRYNDSVYTVYIWFRFHDSLVVLRATQVSPSIPSDQDHQDIHAHPSCADNPLPLLRTKPSKTDKSLTYFFRRHKKCRALTSSYLLPHTRKIITNSTHSSLHNSEAVFALTRPIRGQVCTVHRTAHVGLSKGTADALRT